MHSGQRTDGQPLRGTDGTYEIAPPPGWRRVDAGESDLAVRDDNSPGFVSVRYYDKPGPQLDKIVDWRRNEIFRGNVIEYREERFFLPDSDLLPASMARYEVSGSSTGGRVVLRVLTVLAGERAYEVIGGCRPADEGELQAIMSTWRLTE